MFLRISSIVTGFFALGAGFFGCGVGFSIRGAAGFDAAGDRLTGSAVGSVDKIKEGVTIGSGVAATVGSVVVSFAEKLV